ncbi:MAG TPA: LamG domain-containing protein, partial [Polyangiaceae bacterium]
MLPIRIWIGLVAGLAACSLQMPDESEVFGSAGAHSSGGSRASAGRPGGAGMLGDSGSDENGGAESPSSAGSRNNGLSGASGSSNVGGSSNAGGSSNVGGSSNAGGASGVSGASGFDPAAGLVAYFTFDEPSGAVAANAKDSSKDAKCVGTCTRPDGQLGQAFGIRNDVSPSDWIELPAGILNGHSAITLSVWLRDRSTGRNAAPLFHFSASAKEAIYFVPDDRSSQNSSTGAHLGGVHGGASFVDLWSATPVLTDKVWHQVAFSWNSASIELYIDGKSVGSDPKPSAIPSQLGATSPDYLGRLPDNAGLALFGEIDDLRIYDRV